MIITPAQLNTILQSVNNKIAQQHDELAAFGYTAYKTGLRVGEILNMDRHTIDFDEQRILIRTEKTNNIRVVNIDNIHELIVQRLKLQIPPFMRITYSQLNLQLKKAGLANITVGENKRTTAHLYRHNFAKQMYLIYNSIELVAEELRISRNIANKYINSVIEKKAT